MSIVIHIYLCYIANIKHVFASSTQVIYYLIQGVLCEFKVFFKYSFGNLPIMF